MEADVLALRLEAPRDAAFAMNSLLHVPAVVFPTALERVADVIRIGGLCYLGVYGGRDAEGVRDEDHYVPKRWFVSYSDERLVEQALTVFDIVDFHAVDLGSDEDFHFQSLTLRRR